MWWFYSPCLVVTRQRRATLAGCAPSLARSRSTSSSCAPWPALPWLAIAGLGNVAGLVLTYRALRIGPVSVVAPLVSMEGAVAALLSLATGSSMSPMLLSALGLVVVGGALTATAATDTDAHAQAPRFTASEARLAALLALVAAVLFGASLYATAQIGRSLPIGWAVLAR